MNKITRSKDLMIPKVTTGPISASTKVYTSPEGHPDVRVPFREIALSEGAAEKSFRVYDPSGPYTDAHATIDVEKGLPAHPRRLGARARRRRGIRRPRHQAGGQRQRLRQAPRPRLPQQAGAAAGGRISPGFPSPCVGRG